MSRDTVFPVPVAGERIVVMAASTRAGSINQALARNISDGLSADGEPVGFIYLCDYPMPLFHADLEAAEGIPPATHALASRVSAVDVLVIVSPEYNGAFTPLLKNTIDWLSRVDTRILANVEVLLASASPGRGGGATGLAMVRQWLSNIGVTVADETLSLGSAELGDDGTLSMVDPDQLARFVGQATALVSAAP